MDNINTWTGLSVEELIRMTEDRDKWRKYVDGGPAVGSRTAKEQTEQRNESSPEAAAAVGDGASRNETSSLSKTLTLSS